MSATEDFKAVSGGVGALVLILAPLTGGIIARTWGQPLWYGAVAGGWVCVAIGIRTARRLARIIQAQTEATQEVGDIATKMRESLQRLQAAEVHTTTDGTVPPRDWVREPPTTRSN